MKQIILSFFCLLITFSSVLAQTLYTKTDTIPIYADSVILSVPEKTRGEIQWQYSKDSETWQYINTSHKDSLLIDNFDSSGFYRAEIIEGTCNPIYSDTSYLLRKLTSEEELVLLESKPNITFVGSENGSTSITVIDSTDIYNKIEIHSNQITDSIKPGWILIDTTGTGRIILVEDITILKNSNFNTGLKEKIIKGIQVSMDFMFKDQDFSYSSPANRTKNSWDNQLKLTSSKHNDIFDFEIKSQGENFTASIANDKIALSFNKTDLWKVKNGNDQLSITIEKGSIELKPSLDFAANYKPIAIATKLLTISNPALLLAGDYITKGDLEKLKIITYNDLDFNLDFKISVSTKADLSGFIKPVSLGKFTYAVMAGPVVLTIQTELIARLTTAISGEIDISPKMEWNNNVVLGVEANKIGDEIDRNFIYDYSSEKSLSTSIDGKIKFKERLEIVPRVEVLAMGLVGLKGEIIPYQEFVINASISDNSPLLYDCSLDVGIDANASFLLSAFHSNKLSADIYSKNFEILAKKNLYKRPSSLSYISGNNQVAGSTQILSELLKAKVLDSRNSKISSCVVFFDVISGGGKLENPYVISNSEGIVENQWTLGAEGVQEVRVYLKNANEKIIENSVLTYTATISQSTIPTLSTTAVVNITSTTATVDGTITSNGDSSITARGVCWNTTGNPTINDSKNSNGTGIGNFTSELDYLESNTTYYARAYATNSVGTAYGEVVSFITLQNITLPVVSTIAVSEITETSATSGGNITNDGGAEITARGVCWNTTGTPTITDNKTTDGTGTGNYIANLTELSANTTYYVRAYATNSQGTSYGEKIEFTTLEETGTNWPRDTETAVVDVTNPATGKTWMDRNLGATGVANGVYGHNGDLYQWGRAADGHEKRNSSTITTLSSTDTPEHGYFILSNSNTNYDWRSPQNNNLWQGVNGTNNPCPSGYRIPTEAEWEAERTTWGNNNYDGAFDSPLKIPVTGFRSGSTGTLLNSSRGCYWTSSFSSSSQQVLYLRFNFNSASLCYGSRSLGCSVRCIKD